MLFSATAIHGIYALCYLNRQQRGTAVSADEVATAVRIPKDYASKVLRRLVDAGLVDSVIGRGGGYALAKELGDISLVVVLDALNPPQNEDRLRPRCCHGEPSRVCGAHRGLLRLNARVRRAISKETLTALVGPVGSHQDAPVSTYISCVSEKENHNVVAVS